MSLIADGFSEQCGQTLHDGMMMEWLSSEFVIGGSPMKWTEQIREGHFIGGPEGYLTQLQLICRTL